MSRPHPLSLWILGWLLVILLLLVLGYCNDPGGI